MSKDEPTAMPPASAPTPNSRAGGVSSKRRQQLIDAKRRQRERDKASGQDVYQVKLEAPYIARLKAGMSNPAFVSRLKQFLDDEALE